MCTAFILVCGCLFLVAGNFGTAFIELLVGSEDDGPYLTLLPSKMIMTPQESKKGLNRTGLLTVTQGVPALDLSLLEFQP